MKFNFSHNMPGANVHDASSRFDESISDSLISFIRHYTPYLGNAMAQITSNFTDNQVRNFGLLVDGVSWELARIKKEGKSDNPLADVKGVCSFQFAAYCHCHVPNAQRSIYWQMNTMLSRIHIWIHTTTMPGRKAGLLVL